MITEINKCPLCSHVLSPGEVMQQHCEACGKCFIPRLISNTKNINDGSFKVIDAVQTPAVSTAGYFNNQNKQQ